MSESAASPPDFVRTYEQATNSHDIAQLTPLIAPEAVCWFSDGSHCGRDAILTAIAETFATIRDETYEISDLEWIAVSGSHAVCRYTFRWVGTINGQPRTGSGVDEEPMSSSTPTPGRYFTST
ncbi:DUF4440 domain-containing protein [Actinopolymorpha rutila]|uniref:Ketosteroid isomerase-like protein n=1 Tax=Actinopolymorpha rutila TaxID=446787 RepID=A0A852ZD44_9ACTN|nr:ketosteroid isomerase-like protein [Actinopolymorpha rutila]